MRLTLFNTLILAASLLAGIAGCGPDDARGGAGAVAKKKLTRDEVRSLVEGKTKAEVLKAIGKPTKTKEGDTEEYWLYEKIAIDPITGNSSNLSFYFRKGKDSAVSLNFF